MLFDTYDPARRAVINADELVPENPDMPQCAIGVYSKPIVDACVKRTNAVQLGSFHSCMGELPIWDITLHGTRAAVFTPIPGAPGSVSCFEEVRAAGAKSFVFFGSCGVLRHEIADGHIILPTAAVRDEGTSYHYLPPEDEVTLDAVCLKRAAKVLDTLGLPYVQGKTWTTDAFYRETQRNLARRKAQGCIVVEMECAGLAAAAKFHGVSFAEFFFAADNLDAQQWERRSLEQQGILGAEQYMAAAFSIAESLAQMHKKCE